MDATDWEPLKRLFEQAKELPAEEQRAFLQNACADDPDRRAQLGSLLDAADEADPFFDSLADAVLSLSQWSDAPDVAREPDPLIGRVIDQYRIDEKLGQGGMGTVYLAEDLRHNRQVAMKVLRHDVAATLGVDRFLHEIQIAAHLIHPHIVPLHDSGEADGLLYFVMPYLEGETLRDRLKREGPLPLEDALQIAREVADALDHAHSHSVVHRDIKPENILFEADHAVVADFGIAKAVSEAGTEPLTETGISVGTPSYMSPEQAMGQRDLDARSDVYSLGAVVYEMLVGEPPHGSGSSQAIVARILNETAAPIREVRDLVPPNVDAAVQRALAKSPADRFRSAAEFSAALSDPSFTLPSMAPGTAPPPELWRWRWFGMGAVAVAALAAALAVWVWPGSPPAPSVSRSFVAFPADEALKTSWGQSVALSPDGANLAYIGPSVEGTAVWVKARGDLRAQRLGGTEGAFRVLFDPSGENLAFVVSEKRYGQQVLRRVPVSGGPSTTLAAGEPYVGMVSWGTDGFLYLSGTGRELLRIPEEGGDPEMLLRVEELVGWTPPPHPPHVHALPSGWGVLFVVLPRMGALSDAEIVVLDLRTREHRILMPGLGAWYVETGHLLVLRADGTLLGVPFDQDALTVEGKAVLLLDDIATFGDFVPDRGLFELTVAANGTLAYLSSGPPGTGGLDEVVWVSRSGAVTPMDPGWRFDLPRDPGLELSPDGTRLAIGLKTEAGDDIWIKQLPNRAVARLTFQPGEDIRPHWSRDGRSVLYESCGVFDPESPGRSLYGCDVYARRADGAGDARLVLTLGEDIWDASGSEGSEWLLLRVGLPGSERGSRDVLGLRPGTDSLIVPVFTTEFDETAAALSPDGRWIAYQSDESGRWEVFVRPFPNIEDGKWQVSQDGGITPLWAHSGRELFYLTPEHEMVSVAVDTKTTFAVQDLQVLFQLGPEYVLTDNGVLAAFDIDPEDQRFVMIRTVDAAPAAPQLVLVENWFQELKEKMERQ